MTIRQPLLSADAEVDARAKNIHAAGDNRLRFIADFGTETWGVGSGGKQRGDWSLVLVWV
jgi:hypothetical protein